MLAPVLGVWHQQRTVRAAQPVCLVEVEVEAEKLLLEEGAGLGKKEVAHQLAILLVQRLLVLT